MTVVSTEVGYLERPYLDFSYSTGGVYAAVGQQAKFVINGQVHSGMQVEISIVDDLNPVAQQAELHIQGSGDDFYQGQQARVAIIDEKLVSAQQAEFRIEDSGDDFYQGQQFNIIVGKSAPYGMQAKFDNIAHLNCDGYLSRGYLVDPYMSGYICAYGGQQASMRVVELTASGQQAELHIQGPGDDFYQGQQAQFTVTAEFFYGQQADFATTFAKGQQVNISLYNTTNLRLLCEFPSRGLEGATGNNAWGNPAGKGLNWKASSTEAGDFDASNLNTDIVEQVWRSNSPTITGIELDCDTERAQGVFLDTFALLGHNLTSSATVNLIGSNTSDFSVIGVTIPLSVGKNDPNLYYIAPELPNSSYRYWRIAIDDSSNNDGYIQVGAIVFGASRIFFGECFVDEIEFQLKDFADKVDTEGFTNISNSRAQKKVLRLDFRSLAFTKGNFSLMRDIFQLARTTLKCLYIPTPDPNNLAYTSRFAVFAKMVQVPLERHNNKGSTADYVSFTLELDESQ